MKSLRAVKNLYRIALKLAEPKLTLKESILMPIDFKTLDYKDRKSSRGMQGLCRLATYLVYVV